jgi:hypothetical protein
LAPRWKQVSTLQVQGGAEARDKISIIRTEIAARIHAFNELPADQIRRRGIGALAMRLGETEEPKNAVRYEEILRGIDKAELIAAMREYVKADPGEKPRYKTTVLWESPSKRTPFGTRVARALERLGK